MSRSSRSSKSFPLRQALPLLASSSSLMTSHGVALATAVAVSGTVILIALCRQKPFSVPATAAALDRNSTPPWCQLRPCISSSEERKRERANRRKKQQQQQKKRVRFAAEVVEFDVGSCNEAAEELLAQHPGGQSQEEEEERRPAPGMPANRVALYNGILRDRVMQRMACSY